MQRTELRAFVCLQSEQCFDGERRRYVHLTRGDAPHVTQARGLGHATCTAGGAEPAPLAAECDELLRVALVATPAEEAFVQTAAAALQVGVKLPLDAVWKWSAGFRAKRTKRGIVLLHQLIQQVGFRRCWA